MASCDGQLNFNNFDRGRGPSLPQWFSKVWWATVALAPLVAASIQGPLQLVALAQHSLGAAAVALAVLRIVEMGRWILGGIWNANTAGLLALDGLGLLALMLASAYFGLHDRASFVLALLCAVPLLVFWLTRKRFDGGLTTRLEEARHAGRPFKPLLKCIEVVCPSARDNSVVIAINLKPELSRALRGLHRLATVGPRVVALWIAILALAIASTMLAVVATGHVVTFLQGSGANAGRAGGGGASSTGAPPAPTTAPPAGQSTPSQPNAGSSGTPPSSPARSGEEWDGECTQTPSNSTLLQREVEIEELYVGNEFSREGRHPRFHVPATAGEPPGRKQGGCTLAYHNDEARSFVWAWGEIPSTGRHLSIAIDDPSGPALFLEPAAREVYRLIQKYGEVGGLRRFDADGGDFYPVDTTVGTYILIRREKGTDKAAGAYEVIPPPVAEIWVTTIDHSHRFLWPRRAISEGRVVYDFDTDTPVTTVAYTVPYRATPEPEPQISETELQRAAGYAN